MKRRTHRWINGARGAISLLLAILLLPFFSLAAVLVEAGRYQSAAKTLDGVLGSASISTLSDYDKYLKERFGLLAVSQDKDLTNTLTGYVNNTKLTDLSSVDLDSITAEGMYPLADTTVLRRQILEYSKVLVPARVATDGIGIDELVKKLEKATKMVPLLNTISSGCNSVSAEADALEALEDARDAAKDVQSEISNYNSTFTQWQSKVQALADHLATARPTDEDEAKDWDDKKKDLADEAEDARKDYEDAIGDLISDLDTLQSKVEGVVNAQAKAESSAVDFGLTVAESELQMQANSSDLSKEEKKEMEELIKTNSAFHSAVNSGTADINSNIKDCLDSFDDQKLLNASAQLQADKSKVANFDTDAVTGTTRIETGTYHTAEVSGLADADALDQLLDSSVDEVNQNGLFDFVSSMLAVMNTLFRTKTVFDPELNSRLDTDYYNSTYGGLPGEKDRGQAANALATGNAADEERSKDYLAAIDPDYDPNDPYGTGSSLDTSTLELIMRDLRDMMNAAEDLKDSFGDFTKLLDFFTALKDLVVAIGSLVVHTVQFLTEIVSRIAEIVLGAAYERLLLNGYLVYNLPNRTTYDTGSTLTDYKFSKIAYGEVPYGELYQFPGGTLAALIQAITNEGGVTNKNFSGAELEYILWGFNSEIGNQSMQFFFLYMVRLLLNLPTLMTNQEVQSYISAAGPLAPLVAAIYIFGEPYADALILVNRGDVPLVKGTPYFTIKGLPKLASKFTSLPLSTNDLSGNIEKEAIKLEKDSGGGNDVAGGAIDILPMNYTEYCLLGLMIFGSEELCLQRLTTIIQAESTAYREQNRSLSQVAGGISKSFDIDESYTVIRAQAEGSLVQLLPVPSLSTNSVFRVDRVIYRGY